MTAPFFFSQIQEIILYRHHRQLNMQHQLHSKILSLAEPLAQAQGLDIWGLEIIGSGRLLLRLYVESSVKPGSRERNGARSAAASAAGDGLAADDDFVTGVTGVTGEQGVNIDECARLSRSLGFVLETEDIIPGAYTLEVSSPGLERVFFKAEQVRPYVGQRLSLALNQARPEYPGRKNFVGTIQYSGRFSGQPLDQPAGHSPAREPGREPDENSFNFLPDEGPEPGSSPVPLVIHWPEVKKAHLIYDFEAGKGKKRSPKD